MKTLFVVVNHRVAQAAGMGGAQGLGQFYHRQSKDVRFWWPEVGIDQLRGQRFDMVVVDASVPRYFPRNRSEILAHVIRHDTVVVEL